MTRDSLMVARSAWAGCCWLLSGPGILMPASPSWHKRSGLVTADVNNVPVPECPPPPRSPWPGLAAATRAGVRVARRSAAGAAPSPPPAPSCSAPACTEGGGRYFYICNKIFSNSNSNTTCGWEVSTWLASRGRQCWVEESSCGSSLANQRGALGHVIRCGDLIGCQLLTWPRGAAGVRAARRPARRALCPPSRSPADKIILIEDKRSKVKTAF